MKKYKIKIYNSSDVIVYDDIIEAATCNNALLLLLDKLSIFDGDTIKIEEKEN